METITDQDHEIRAWLGDGWTEPQITKIIKRYRAAESVTPEDEREALLVAIAQLTDGTVDREDIVAADVQAQQRAEETRVARRAGLRADVAAGMSERGAAEVWQVSRRTARAWMGKRDADWAL